MRARRRWWMALVALALVAPACGGGGDGGGGDVAQTGDTTAQTAAQPAAQDVAPADFPAGTTMAALKQKGRITVGTKFDQPLFGQKSATGGDVEGFDVEIAKLVAQGIFGGSLDDAKGKVDFVEAVSKNREPFIQEGRVDMVVATYTINDARRQVVDFAGPYYIAGQDIMVKADDDSIKGVQDLNGKKVCSVQGSTSIKNVQAQAPQADLSVTFDTYSKCAEALGDGRVQAVTTDDVILLGLVDDYGEQFKLVNAPFTQERYGIGVKKGDAAFRNFVNDRLEEIERNGEWQAAYQRTVGQVSKETPQPPSVDRY